MSSALWCVTNGRAARRRRSAASSASRPRGSRARRGTARIAATTFARDLEHAARLGVDDQVEVALAVARLDVGQPVPLLGQRQVALGQERRAPSPRSSARRARAEQVPLDADVVAEVEQLEDLEVALGQRVLADVDLDALDAVGQDEEVRLAEAADRQDRPAVDRLDLRRPRAPRPGARRAPSTSAVIVSVRVEAVRVGRHAERLRAPRGWRPLLRSARRPGS